MQFSRAVSTQKYLKPGGSRYFCGIKKRPPPERTGSGPAPRLLRRHTYATRLVESGMNIKQIQYLLGHDDVHLTLSIYSHVTQNRPEELIGAVSAAFSAPQEPALESV